MCRLVIYSGGSNTLWRPALRLINPYYNCVTEIPPLHVEVRQSSHKMGPLLQHHPMLAMLSPRFLPATLLYPSHQRCQVIMWTPHQTPHGNRSDHLRNQYLSRLLSTYSHLICLYIYACSYSVYFTVYIIIHMIIVFTNGISQTPLPRELRAKWEGFGYETRDIRHNSGDAGCFRENVRQYAVSWARDRVQHKAISLSLPQLLSH